MAKTSFAHKPKLRRYIESRGTRLPSHFSRFVRPGDNETECLFCGQPHDSNEVMLYTNNPEDGAEGTGAFMCNICFGFVKEMETKIMGNKGLGNLYNSTDMGTRLDMFVNDLSFETSVTKHFQFLREAFEKTPEEVECCYFCKNHVVTGYFMLKVPISGAEYIDGGNIRCCFTCRDLVIDLLPEKSITAFLKNRFVSLVECASCGVEYNIGGGEMEYRLQAGTEDKHMCPECVVVNMQKLQIISKKLEGLYVMRSDDYTIERFIEEDCEYCGGPIEIDLTLRPGFLKVTIVSHDEKLMCADCADGTHGPITAVVQGSRVWTVYNTPTPRQYRVVVRSTQGRKLLEQIVSSSIGMIILQAYPTLNDFVEGQQSKLKF